MTGAVGQRRVPLEYLKTQLLPLPPLNEQQRIVAKLGKLSAKSRRARENLDHVPRLVEKYKQAILAAAFRGELTRKWRSQTGRPHNWETITLALQLPYPQVSESMGNHDSDIVDANGVD